MYSPIRPYYLSILGLILIIESILSLKLVELHVPTHAPLGQSAQLSCRWELGPGDVLYSVKWYKDGKEFFRHVPRNIEPRSKFPLPGVVVEQSDASGSNLTLSPVTMETGGRYRCEVSGEKPLFITVSDHTDMTVLVLPEKGPVISGFQHRYRIGDTVTATCVSGKSQPATKLTWYINNEPVSPNFVESAQQVTEGMTVTTVRINFIVTENYFIRNIMKLKCLATLAPMYWRSNEESAVQDKTLQGHVAVRNLVPNELPTRADRVHSIAHSASKACDAVPSGIMSIAIMVVTWSIMF